MVRIRFVTLLGILILCITGDVFSQWEWAGGIPLSDYGSIGSTGGWIYINPAYSGPKIACSTDAGESWFMSSAGGGFLNFALLTSAHDSVLLALYGGNVMNSLDRGLSWTPSDSGLPPGGVNALAPSGGTSSDSDGVVVTTSPTDGVFVSHDRAAHWVPADSGLSSRRTTCVTALASAFLVGTADQGVFRSVDDGATWSRITNGFADTSVDVLAASGGVAVAVSGTHVYTSVDSGSTWEVIPDSLPVPAQSLVIITRAGTNPNVALFAVTTAGYFRRIAGESSWTCVSPSASLWSGPHTLTCVDSTLFAVSYHTAYRSKDLGNTWFPLGAFTGGEVLTGHTSSKQPRPCLYVGPFASTNSGSSWTGLRQSTDESNVTAFSVSQDTSLSGDDQLIFGTDSGKVAFSDDGGQSWKTLRQADSMPVMYQSYAVAEMDGIAFLSLQNNQYFHTPDDSIVGVYRTTDAGTSWQKMNTAGLTDTLVNTLFVFRGNNGGRILFAGGWMHLFRSTNDGETWTESSLPPVRTGKKFLRKVNDTLFLCTQGAVSVEYLPDGGQRQTFDSAGVFRSTDDGESWIDVTGNLHSAFIRGFAVASVPQYPNRTFAAACSDVAVLTSTVGGADWEGFTDGLPRISRGGGVGADEQYVYVGLGGIKRRPWLDATLTSGGGPRMTFPPQLSLSQNYPNPFNPTTTIAYDLSKESHVSLEVFNTLGQKIATLVNANQRAGQYSVQFDGRGFASGVYFYRMQAGSFVETRKLLLLR